MSEEVNQVITAICEEQCMLADKVCPTNIFYPGKISYDTNLIIVTCYLAIKNSTQTYSNKIWYLPQCAYLDMTSIQKH